MTDIETLSASITEQLGDRLQKTRIACGELTIEVDPSQLHPVCLALRDQPAFDFKLLVDLCGVDYLHYGVSEWETESATGTGFERGVEPVICSTLTTPRFAVV